MYEPSWGEGMDSKTIYKTHYTRLINAGKTRYMKFYTKRINISTSTAYLTLRHASLVFWHIFDLGCFLIFHVAITKNDLVTLSRISMKNVVIRSSGLSSSHVSKVVFGYFPENILDSGYFGSYLTSTYHEPTVYHNLIFLTTCLKIFLFLSYRSEST